MKFQLRPIQVKKLKSKKFNLLCESKYKTLDLGLFVLKNWLEVKLPPKYLTKPLSQIQGSSKVYILLEWAWVEIKLISDD